MNSPSSRHRLWVLSIALGVLLIAVAGVYSTPVTPRLNQPRTIAYSALVVAMQAGQVDSVRIRPAEEIRAWLKAGAVGSDREIRVIYSAREVSGFLAAAQTAGVALSFDPEPRDYSSLIGLGVSLLLITAAVVVLRR